MTPLFFAHGPNLFVAVPGALLLALCLYGSPALSFWLTRRQKKRFALIIAALGGALGAYITVTEFPADKEDMVIWLFAGCLPLISAIAAIFVASRATPPLAPDA